MTDPNSNSLSDALEKYEFSLEDDVVKRLDAYCRLLWQWNEKLNLTRHTTYDTFVGRDVLDTVELSKLLEPGERVLDVGTGGGVPGIVLAILRPDLEVSLSESVGKKAQVVDEMVSELHLPVPVYACRAEDLLEDFRFDALVARAVGPLWKMCKWFDEKWHLFGRLLAVKGPNWPAERGEARHRGLMHDVNLRRLVEYKMSGTESNSVILKLWAKGSAD